MQDGNAEPVVNEPIAPVEPVEPTEPDDGALLTVVHDDDPEPVTDPVIPDEPDADEPAPDAKKPDEPPATTDKDEPPAKPDPPATVDSIKIGEVDYSRDQVEQAVKDSATYQGMNEQFQKNPEAFFKHNLGKVDEGQRLEILGTLAEEAGYELYDRDTALPYEADPGAADARELADRRAQDADRQTQQQNDSQAQEYYSSRATDFDSYLEENKLDYTKEDGQKNDPNNPLTRAFHLLYQTPTLTMRQAHAIAIDELGEAPNSTQTDRASNAPERKRRITKPQVEGDESIDAPMIMGITED